MKTKTLVLLSLAPLFLAVLTTSTVHATGTCTGNSNKQECQYAVGTQSEAPTAAISNGIRLNAGISDALFKNIGGVPPYYLSNGGTSDLFVPQATSGEFLAFIAAAKSGAVPNVSVHYAVVPTLATATAHAYPSCPPYPTGGSLATQTFALPFGTVTGSPITVSNYAQVPQEYISSPQNITTTGTVYFPYTRKDCSADNEGHASCNTVTYTNNQTLTYTAMGTAPSYAWNTESPVVSDTLYLGSTVVSDCLTQAPIFKGACGSANGQVGTTAPTTNLCATGDASAVNAVVTSNGVSWGWTCNDVQGTAAGVTNNALTSGIGCAACQSMSTSKTNASNPNQTDWYDGCGHYQTSYVWTGWDTCSLTCGGGTQTRTCTNVSTGGSYPAVNCGGGAATQSCNLQVCTTYAWDSWGACSAACGGGTQTRACRGSDGKTYDASYCGGGATSQSCNPTACVTYDWSAWGACSATCGGGTQTRTCNGSDGLTYASAYCGGAVSSQSCNTQSCSYTKTNTTSGYWHYENASTHGSNSWGLSDLANFGPAGNKVVDTLPFSYVSGTYYKATFSFSGKLLSTTDPGWSEGGLYVSVTDTSGSTEYWRSGQMRYWTGPTGPGVVSGTYMSDTPFALPSSGDYLLTFWFAAKASSGDPLDIWSYSDTLTVAPSEVYDTVSGAVTYTTNGTYSWTAPVGVYFVRYQMVGAGAAGLQVWGSTGSIIVALGGKAGAYQSGTALVTPGTTYSIVVGKAGSGTTNAAGGSTSFNGISVSGGSGTVPGGAASLYPGSSVGTLGGGGNCTSSGCTSAANGAIKIVWP